MTWQPGQPWRVVESLQRLNAQIRAAHPEAIPPATPASSWGSIADDAHSTTSDHYPHYYAALGSVAVVCARDFPHAPALGLDAHAIAEQLRLSHDSRIGYVISNRRITGPNHAWGWDAYTGSDPHDTHIHVSSVHTAAADDTRDWQIGDDVSKADVIAGLKELGYTPRLAAILENTGRIVAEEQRGSLATGTVWVDDAGRIVAGDPLTLGTVKQMAAVVAGVAALDAAVDAVAARVDIDPAELDAIKQAARVGAEAALAAAAEDFADRVAARVPQAQADMVKAAVKDALREGTGL